MLFRSINWHLEQGKPVFTAIMDGAAQIVTPAFVSLLCICIVFVPMFFLPGVAGFLFVPDGPGALAVSYAVKVWNALWWIALFNLFWNFTEDYFTIPESKRLFSIVAGGLGCLVALGAVAAAMPRLRAYRIDELADDGAVASAPSV